jgi:hypothetical protein
VRRKAGREQRGHGDEAAAAGDRVDGAARECRKAEKRDVKGAQLQAVPPGRSADLRFPALAGAAHYARAKAAVIGRDT